MLPYLPSNQHNALFWEHNFRSGPLGYVPGVRDRVRKWEILVFGASGRTWLDPGKRAELEYEPRSPGRFHHEIGASLQPHRYVRLDGTRRLDESDWSIGFSVAFYDIDMGRFGR